MGFPAADALKRHLTEAKERNVWTNASTAQPWLYCGHMKDKNRDGIANK